MGLGAAASLVGIGALLPGRSDTALAASTKRATLALSSAPSADNVVLQWNSAAVQAMRDLRPAPTIAARTLAIVHTAIYDAWAVYDPAALGTRFGGALRRPTSESTPAAKSQAISFAAYRALADQFPSSLSQFQSLMTALGYNPGDASMDPTTPTGVGNMASQALLDFRYVDGSSQLGDLDVGADTDYTGDTPVNDPTHLTDPSHWQPLTVPDGHGGIVGQRCVTPHWCLVTPFALTSGGQFRPAGPATYPSARYERQALTILHYSAQLRDEQKVMAEFWADGPSAELTAPPIWSVLAQFVSHRDNHDLDHDVRMYFALTNAMADALIAVWDAKRAFDSVRPVTAIHFLYAGKQVSAWGGPGKGTQMINGEEWKPYLLATPAFPEFVSAHSAVSAAASEVLKSYTGSDSFGASFTKPAGMSRIEPKVTPAADVTLRWDTFTDTANQAGMSRRYGGIHFVKGDMMGRALGRLVGAEAWKKAQDYIAGHG